MPRRKDIGLGRRRVRDEDEVEVGGEVDLADDSVSENSGLSDEDDDEDNESDATFSDDGEQSRVSLAQSPELQVKQLQKNGVVKPSTTVESGKSDTHVMLNGIKGQEDATELDFSEMESQEVRRNGVAKNRRRVKGADGSKGDTLVDNTAQETVFEKRKREHEEYRKKRDADPAFVPNRGAFFMHDHRTDSGGANGFRPFGKGRGRGAPAIVSSQPSEPAETTWKHDMHDSVAVAEKERERLREIRERAQANRPSPPTQFQQPQQPQQPLCFRYTGDSSPRTFNTNVNKGTVAIRVFLPGMPHPRTISDVSIKVYTRLPIHRPPLRRDKPVRIFLPDSIPRYMFPAHARSFVFIPRAMRPGGSGFARGGIVGGGLGPTPPRISSYRNSVYGGSAYGSAYAGSNYASSVAASRRSSMHQDAGRPVFSGAESIFKPDPHGTMMLGVDPRARVMMPPRPIVRLPSAPIFTPLAAPENVVIASTGEQEPLSSEKQLDGAVEVQNTEKEIAPLTMHQPRPQKTVNVENIESPGGFMYPTNTYPSAPFVDNSSNPYYPQHSRDGSYPSQLSSTPHSQIPDQSVHARPFQPYYAPPVPSMNNGGYYMHPQMYPQASLPQYHQGPPPPYVPSPAAMPYMPQQSYMPHMQPSPLMPMQPSPFVPMQQQPLPSTGGPIAQESNGMVYYIDPGQYYAPYGTYPVGAESQQVNGYGSQVNGMVYYPQGMPMPATGNPQMFYAS